MTADNDNLIMIERTMIPISILTSIAGPHADTVQNITIAIKMSQKATTNNQPKMPKMVQNTP